MGEMALVENIRYIVQVYVGALSALYEALSVEASKQTTSEEIVSCIVERLSLNENPGGSYELAEVIGDTIGQECKERRLMPNESPVQLMMLWPKTSEADTTCYRFYLREKSNSDYMWTDNFTMDPQLIKDYFHRFLYQPKDREYPDLCQLPDLNEQTLLENLRARFNAGHIYTYVGSILIAVNPFKFHPIYNPKYVKLYQNRRLGPNLPPHIFAVADSAYHYMLIERKNHCIVISGESGSGKTESTNFLLHHLTALSQKGSHGSGVEQTILSAGPVLEAFGNAKTAHNNNSSRFGKFIQVNYKENGMVHGAVVQKYLLEKSRICSQGRNERNYHVFYYLLAGASEHERQQLHLKKTSEYNYLNRSGCYTVDNVDESYEFSRLKQSMEMVGFTPEKQRRLFSVLSAVLLLGNVEFQPRKSAYHHDEAVAVKNPEVVQLISNLLRVKQETLLAALTAKRARASGETLVINYRLPEAIASRDAMAKCLYGALFDWIVLQVNHALLSKKDTLRDHQGNSIGVLDIFGFEDFGACNSFEQLCINYANEHLQFYFNQHVFKYEQEEYRKEGIRWNNIDFMDNTGCLQLIEGKPNGLLCVLDDQCNFPGATSETLLQKFNSVHKNNEFYEKPQKLEAAFMVIHYAGKLKYQVTEMREKNLDLMRQDIVGVLKNSSMAFVRELVGADPVAVFRWAIVRAFFRAYFAFHEAGRKHRQIRADGNKNNAIPNRFRNHTPNDNIISKQRNTVLSTRGIRNYNENEAAANNNHNRLSWPQFYYHRNRVSVNAGNGKSPEDQARMGRKDPHGHGTTGHPSSTAVFERVLCPDEARVMQRANQIVMKNKSFRPRERGKKGLKNLQTVKTLAGRTGITAANQSQIGKARKQPLTVAAQFQQSLHSLMDTLNQANPFFIRCIKSNSNKIPNQFDEDTVQRQLRYTGMLETVRIRQAGFNVRLTYDEFIQLYRILLPKGLLSSQNDVRNFLATLNLNRDNYQLGCTKIFLRESEKIKLDCKLHQQIMASIVTIQRWFRVCLERRRFVKMRNAVVQIQCFWRRKLAQRTLELMKAQLIAAVHIQAFWRGYKVRAWFKNLKNSLIGFQSHCKGNLARRTFAELKSRVLPMKQKQLTNATSLPIRFYIPPNDTNSIGSIADSGVEIFNDKHERERERERSKRDSDESSGIIEDVESDSVLSSRIELRPTQSLPSVVTGSGSPARVHLSSHPPSTSPHHTQQQQQYYNRVEDTSREGILLDTTLNKRKLSKTRNTAEIQGQQQQTATPDSSLAFIPFRKCSCDSLTSYRSMESQRSSDSHNSSTGQEHPLARQALLNRSEVWDSSPLTLNKSDGEMDLLEQDTSKSAPPVIVRDTVPRFPCWNKEPMYSFPALPIYNTTPSKQIVTRTPSAPPTHNQHQQHQQQMERLLHSPTNTNTNNNNNNNNGRLEPRKRDPKREIIRNNDGLISLPPVRRDPRLSNNESTSRRANDQAALKTFVEFKYPGNEPWATGSGGESLKTTTSPDERDKINAKVIEIPTVPLRTIRKPRREIVCRSMGEEVDSGTTEAKNAALLGTIREVNILGAADLATPTKNIWQLQNSGQFIQHEAEMSLDTLKKSPQHLGGKRSRGITTLDLRRRNSDPATKIGSIVEQPGGPEHSPQAKIDSDTDKLVWKGHTTFTFAGHRFNKVQRFSKDDNCVYCSKQMDAFVAQGYKCAYCKKLFHTKCIQNGGGLEMPCDLVPGRRKYRKHSQTPYDLHKRAVESKFNLTGTSEFTDRTDKIISDARELQLMQDFITKKIYKMESQEGKKPSEVDRVFKQALREFKDNLVATYSVVNKQDFESFNIKYKDLIANFLQVMKTVCHQEQKEEDFPVTMGVNAFRGFMNEFMTSRTEAEKPSKTKRKKEKKRKVEDPIAFAGHLFVLTIINIPTACEICSSFFMWPIERGLVCQSCKLTCHKKCYARVTTDCGKDTAHHGDSKRVFGIPLASLLTGECKIPVVLDRLITTIEMHGLYTEGIYRKSGVSSKVRELKTRMEETSQDGVNFEDYQMHVLASVLKSFLREMPEPLLTFDCYEDFLRAASLTDPQDRISTLFEILRKLPKPNFDLMERLIFHLARVALHEDVNRMNASALAIVFAPCVLRTNKVLPAQDSLNDIGRQTQCIETILMEQLRKVKSTLADIDTLDTACHTATHRLSSLRSSKVFSPEELQPASHQAQQSPQPVEGDDEEALLVGHIQEIQKEKELLTSALPSLTRTTSDDDMLSTDLDGEGSLDDISCTGTNDVTPNLRRARGPVVRSVSGGDPRQSLPPKLKRQSSSDISVVQKAVEECEDAPIMV